MWLGEDLGRSDLIGTGLVIIGSVLSVAFGNHEDKLFTMADIRAFYGIPAFIAFVVTMSIVLIGAYIGVRRLEPMRDELLLCYIKYDEAKEQGDRDQMQLFKCSIDEKKATYAPFEKVHPLLYCALSGLFGGQSVLMAKTVAILLRATIEGENQFKLGLTYVFLFAMVFTIVVQTHYLATALKYFDALYVVPVFQCFWITGSTVGGAIFYQELKDFDLLQSIMFPLGIVITLCGVYALSNRDMAKKAQFEEEDLLNVATVVDDEGSAVAEEDERFPLQPAEPKADDVAPPPETMKHTVNVKRRSMAPGGQAHAAVGAFAVSDELNASVLSSLSSAIPIATLNKRRSLFMSQLTLPALPFDVFHSAPQADGGAALGASLLAPPPSASGHGPARPSQLHASFAVGSSGSIVGSMFVDTVAPFFKDLLSVVEAEPTELARETEMIHSRHAERIHSTACIAGGADGAESMPVARPQPHSSGIHDSAPHTAPTGHQSMDVGSAVDGPLLVQSQSLQPTLDTVQEAAISSGETTSFHQLD